MIRSSREHAETAGVRGTPRAHGGGQISRTRQALRGMSYSEGTALLQPTETRPMVQLKKKDKPEIEATSEAMGQHMVEAMNRANEGPHTLDKGIHYAHNYERLCEWMGQKDRWKDEYRMGHNASGHFVNPYEHGGFMDFRLKKGHSASKAIQAWLEGLTIAECNSSVVAMEIDTVRAALGNEKFDRYFGSENAAEDKAIPEHQRLRVKPGLAGTPAGFFATPTEANKKNEEKKAKGGSLTAEELDALLKPGEWYYFYNHPKYLLKHPGGAWQGENALYMGKNEAGVRIWSGLGASNVTEEQMLDEMVRAYNAPRTRYDERRLKELRAVDERGNYLDKKYDPASGEFPDTITKDDIRKAPPYTLHGTTRKGGFLIEAGVTLDPAKVKALRDRR